MDTIIEFVINNYIWFIVVAVIIIMAIIGYIADKTDFGRKKENKEVTMEQNDGLSPIVEEQNVIDNTPIMENPNTITNENNIMSNENVTDIMPQNNEEIDQSLFTPLTDTQTSEQISSFNEQSQGPIEQQNSENKVEDDIWKF